MDVVQSLSRALRPDYRTCCFALFQAAEPLLRHCDKGVVVDVARGSDDDVGSPVGASVEPDKIRTGDGGYRFAGPQDRPAVRVSTPHPVAVQFEDKIVGRIFDRGDLLEDHFPFSVKILFTKKRVPDQVGEELNRLRQVSVQYTRFVTGMLPGGVRVQ